MKNNIPAPSCVNIATVYGLKCCYFQPFDAIYRTVLRDGFPWCDGDWFHEEIHLSVKYPPPFRDTTLSITAI